MHIQLLPPIMKNILQLTIFLFSIGILACDCGVQSITEKFIQSEFVSNITIIKIYQNKENELGYKADIRINELFKGEQLKSIYIYGRSDNSKGSSCDIYIPTNTKLIAYARKNKDGNYGIGMCSGLVYFNKENQAEQSREINILKEFKSKKINYTNKLNYQEMGNLGENLEEFKGIELNKTYGIYEIIFDSNLKIKKVKKISGFGKKIDKKLIKIIEKTEWAIFGKKTSENKEYDNKLLIGIYYYPRGKENPSFLSQFYL